MPQPDLQPQHMVSGQFFLSFPASILSDNLGGITIDPMYQ